MEDKPGVIRCCSFSSAYSLPLRFKVFCFFARELLFGADPTLPAPSNSTATCAIAALSVPMPSGVFP